MKLVTTTKFVGTNANVKGIASVVDEVAALLHKVEDKYPDLVEVSLTGKRKWNQSSRLDRVDAVVKVSLT